MARTSHTADHTCQGLSIAPSEPCRENIQWVQGLRILSVCIGYCPMLLYSILPCQYWHNFCQLVSAVWLLQQHTITASQLQCAHLLDLEFTKEYKAIYDCCMVSQLHFCWQSIHGLLHLTQDIVHLDPGVYLSQWTLEHMISNLGQEIKQPSSPIQIWQTVVCNTLSFQHCILCCQIYHQIPQSYPKVQSTLVTAIFFLGHKMSHVLLSTGNMQLQSVCS